MEQLAPANHQLTACVFLGSVGSTIYFLLPVHLGDSDPWAGRGQGEDRERKLSLGTFLIHTWLVTHPLAPASQAFIQPLFTAYSRFSQFTAVLFYEIPATAKLVSPEQLLARKIQGKSPVNLWLQFVHQSITLFCV